MFCWVASGAGWYSWCRGIWFWNLCLLHVGFAQCTLQFVWRRIIITSNIGLGPAWFPVSCFFQGILGTWRYMTATLLFTSLAINLQYQSTHTHKHTPAHAQFVQINIINLDVKTIPYNPQHMFYRACRTGGGIAERWRGTDTCSMSNVLIFAWGNANDEACLAFSIMAMCHLYSSISFEVLLVRTCDFLFAWIWLECRSVQESKPPAREGVGLKFKDPQADQTIRSSPVKSAGFDLKVQNVDQNATSIDVCYTYCAIAFCSSKLRMRFLMLSQQHSWAVQDKQQAVEREVKKDEVKKEAARRPELVAVHWYGILGPLYLPSCLFGGVEQLGLFLYALELYVNYIFANYLGHLG